MKTSEFLACSVAFHVLLFVAAVFVPPPFPSPKSESSLTYVELKPERPKEGLTFGYSEDAEGVLSPSPQPLSPQGRGDNGTSEESSSAAQTRQTGPAPAEAPKPQPPAPPKAAPAEAPPAPVPSAPSGQGFAPSFTAQMPASPQVAVTASQDGTKAIQAARSRINFRYQDGFPPPGMVSLRLDTGGGNAAFTASADAPWIVVSLSSGQAPCGFRAGADTGRLSVGFYQGKVQIKPSGQGIEGDEVEVTLLVLPKEAGAKELPHYAWDSYMNGECKVCHLPENLMPSSDFMEQPGLCLLCHCGGGIAQDRVAGAGGHPVGVAAGSGGTKTPSRGTVPTGPKSDMMRTHLPGGKLACITCHNVMEKPGEYARSWELASTEDQRTYHLAKGGWDGMGWFAPRVYAVQSFMKLPKKLSELKKFRVAQSEYTWDEAEGSITFKRERDRSDIVYVSLTNPYLRVTTKNSAICYDCHNENTHAGLNCLACHQVHGTDNIKAVRRLIKTPSGEMKKVVFKARKGKDSFADGICAACHPVPEHKGKDVRGTDCTSCHNHKDGFS